MRCLIGFFGLTRSLAHTAAAIRAVFYEPLRKAGIGTIRLGHFNLPPTITNPRSGEFGIGINRRESALLDLDLCWIEPQDPATIASELVIGRQFPDAFGDQYRSLANLCHQLHSLRRLWSLLQLVGLQADDLVLLLRPDLLYLDPLDPAEHLEPLCAGRIDMIVPRWQGWGGLNDRFAFCTMRSARIYTTRICLFNEACQEMGGMHAETFLRFIAQCHAIRVGFTDLRGVRVRADGRIAPNDVSMMASQAAKTAPAAQATETGNEPAQFAPVEMG